MTKAKPLDTNIYVQIQRYLFQNLKEKTSLSSKVTIFYKVPKNTSFPYVYLGKLQVEDISVKGTSRINIIQDICLYSRDNNIEEILQWTTAIKQTLKKQNISLDSCHISEIQFLHMALDIISDARTHLATSKFKITIEEL